MDMGETGRDAREVPSAGGKTCCCFAKKPASSSGLAGTEATVPSFVFYLSYTFFSPFSLFLIFLD